jgi:hypothetical protein
MINVMTFVVTKQLPVLGEVVQFNVSIQDEMTEAEAKERLAMAYRIMDERCGVNNAKANELLEKEAAETAESKGE